MRDDARSYAAQSRGLGRRLTGMGLLAALAVGGSGCYQSVPLASSPPPSGTRVMASLTQQGSAEMAPVIGAGASGVEGVVIRAEAAQWDLSMLRVEQVAGTDVVWNREVVTFPAGALGTVVERRFNQRRSFLTAGLITAGALLLARVFGSDVFDGGGGGGGGPNPPH